MSGNVNVTADLRRMSIFHSTLLASAKNYLDLTWADSAETEKLIGILTRGEVYLDDVAGTALDYATEGTAARALLLDYARYVLAGALQDFATDFSPELLKLHLAGEVTQYNAAQASGTTV